MERCAAPTRSPAVQVAKLASGEAEEQDRHQRQSGWPMNGDKALAQVTPGSAMR